MHVCTLLTFPTVNVHTCIHYKLVIFHASLNQGLPLPIVLISFGAAFNEYGTDKMLVKEILSHL